MGEIHILSLQLAHQMKAEDCPLCCTSKFTFELRHYDICWALGFHVSNGEYTDKGKLEGILHNLFKKEIDQKPGRSIMSIEKWFFWVREVCSGVKHCEKNREEDRE